MSDWTLEASEEGAAVSIRLAGRPASPASWGRSCAALEKAWPASGRVELEVHGAPTGGPGLSGEGASSLVDAAARLLRRRGRSRAVLIARVDGSLAGPWLALALSAELLVVAEGMAAEALFWEDSRLLTPGEMLAVAARLGRARGLEWALSGATFDAAELLRRRAALGGEAGDRAWASAKAGSLVAQGAAASLMRTREPGRAAFETLERTAFAACFDAADREEGVRAFADRREPEFPSQRPKSSS